MKKIKDIINEEINKFINEKIYDFHNNQGNNDPKEQYPEFFNTVHDHYMGLDKMVNLEKRFPDIITYTKSPIPAHIFKIKFPNGYIKDYVEYSLSEDRFGKIYWNLFMESYTPTGRMRTTFDETEDGNKIYNHAMRMIREYKKAISHNTNLK